MGVELEVILGYRHSDDKPLPAFWVSLSANHYILCKHFTLSDLKQIS